MKRTLMGMLTAAAFAVVVAVPAQAQDYRFDVGIFGGGQFYTSSLDDIPGTPDDEDNTIRFAPGWNFGLQGTGWVTPQFGIRVGGSYSERPLVLGNTFETAEEQNVLEDINLWDASADLLYRFLGPNTRDFLGVEFLPYIAGGLGAKFINPADQRDDQEATFFNTDPDGTGEFFAIDGDPATKLMGRVALGGDVRVHPNVAIRLEVGDKIWDSPFVDPADVGTDDAEDVGNVVNEIYGTVGVHYLFGLIEPAPVVMAPPPPPAPAPPPEPEPEPEEDIVVCVIDPTVDEGLREVDAIYLPNQRDTVVVEAGRRVPLSQSVGQVMVARDTDWYVAGRPLEFEMDAQTTEFVSFGGARQIPADQLAYLGTQNGIAVYADEDDVEDVREQMEELRDARMDNDVDDIIEQEAELQDAFDDIDVLYVPVRSTGCVFQALQRVEEVIKGAN